MSINHLINANNKIKYDIHVRKTNTKQLSLEVNDVETIDFHSLETQGVKGTCIMSDGNGALSWSNGVMAQQADVFLTNEPILLELKNATDWVEFSLPMWKEGSFEFVEEKQLVKINLNLYYRYRNSTSHLPFHIQVRLNGNVEYDESFGSYDKVDRLNKITDTLIVNANVGDLIEYYIKKDYDDDGDIELQKYSHYTYELF
jgi:hypothetical protein